MKDIPQPTSEQCSANALVYEDDDTVGYALWHPQVGGYCGRAVALLARRNWLRGDGCGKGRCFDLIVWHDGDFPIYDGPPAATFHFCSAEQFVRFGQEVAGMIERHRVAAPEEFGG